MPSFELKQTEDLKAWLVKELEPICDADPEVLSDYVLALLRHDATDGDLQNLLKEQLEDFLAEKTAPFVAKTMGALKTQSYLPPSQRSSSSGPSTLQVEGSGSRKRSADDEGRNSPAKMQRAPGETEDTQRLPRGPSSSRGDHRQDGTRDRGQEGRRDGRPKPACRDFHQRGFCPRGDECRYDHTIPGASFGANPMMNMMGPMGQPYPMQQGMPHNAFMGMNQQQQQMHQGQAGGFSMGMQGAPGWQGSGNGSPAHQQSMVDMNGPMANGGESGGDLGARLGGQQSSDLSLAPLQVHDGGFRGGGRGGRGGFGGGMGRGGARGTFEKRHTSNTTLVIENVPAENLDLVKINEYFKKFGTITNIQIDVDSKKALVSYSQPGEAKAAHTSPEVIFNNRFVKVYFQKLDDPGIGAKAKEAPVKQPGPPLVNNFIPGQTSNKFVRPDLAQTKSKESQEAAQKKLDTLLAEQKEIMTKLTTATTPADEKKTMMGRFGALEKEIKAATEEVRSAYGAAAQSSEAAPAPSSDGNAKWKEQRESNERDQLDRELEAHSKGGTGTTTEELKAHLAKLQAEASKLGIDAEAAAAGRGGYRGRGRAAFRGASSRGFSSYAAPRGRGGAAARMSMSIDNRPTKLIVTDFAAEKKDKAKEHFQQFGDVEGIEDQQDGSFIVNYKIRLSGERALRAGLALPEVGQVKAVWATDGPGKDEVRDTTNLDAEAEQAGQGDEEEGERDEHFRR